MPHSIQLLASKTQKLGAEKIVGAKTIEMVGKWYFGRMNRRNDA
jgi:hypothetical protein